MSSKILEARKEMFRRGMFDFITVRNGLKHEKQELALQLLTDHHTVEIGYGGAAGGAKSWTGCTWLAFMSICYPGTRWFIAREELKRLRESTLITFFKVCKHYGIERDIDWKYNGQDHYIQFVNGSRIDLLELKYYPSDPLYERLGSVEYTGGFIDELGESNFKGYDVLKTRIGRHLNDKYGLLRKQYSCFNPKKSWIYQYFYKRKDFLPPHIKFIQALIYDNPFRESGYEMALKSITDPVTKARLLQGDWEYDTDPAALCDYNAIIEAFTNNVKGGDRYVSADLAMQGRDRFIAGVWNGLTVRIAIDQEKSTGKSIEDDLRNLIDREKIERKNVIVDSDGLGAYLESYLKGIHQFHGGGRAINSEEFANLKSECAYKLAELINKREIRIICSYEQEERIKEELSLLKADNIDADEKKKRIIKKEKMKELLNGRSPDYLDMLLMRMKFELSPSVIWQWFDDNGDIMTFIEGSGTTRNGKPDVGPVDVKPKKSRDVLYMEGQISRFVHYDMVDSLPADWRAYYENNIELFKPKTA